VKSLLTVLSAVLVAGVGVFGLLSFFTARDQAGVSGHPAKAPGTLYPDQGHRHIKPGDPRPKAASSPPTSGPHVPVPIKADRRAISRDQLLHALELGDVVLLYPGHVIPGDLVALQRQLGPFSPKAAAEGQAVILARGPGKEIEALAWRRIARARNPADPRLAAFTDYWLGQGAAQ
jgi:hypothetical protein